MSKNGWYACIIVFIVVSCACVFCLMVSLVGIASYRSISSTLSVDFPFIPPTPVSTSTPPCHSPFFTGGGINPHFTLWTAMPSQTQINHCRFPQRSRIRWRLTNTLTTLENTLSLSTTRLTLAQRLLGLDNLSPTEAAPSSFYAVGDKQTFWVGNGDMDNFRVKATLGT